MRVLLAMTVRAGPEPGDQDAARRDHQAPDGARQERRPRAEPGSSNHTCMILPLLIALQLTPNRVAIHP